MNAETLIYIGSALPLLWGVAHLLPTKSIIQGFGDISADNKNIIAMEWIIEGIALIFLGILVAAVTAIEPRNSTSKAVYITASSCLISLAIVSLFTGFRISLLPFKLCPVIFSLSAMLITLGWILL
jgi:hypothetical protein